MSPAASKAPVRCWLFKSEPGTFSIEDLEKSPKKTTSWGGIRNYQARNFLRDDVKRGDVVFFYHSSTDEPAIVGTAIVTRSAHPDPTASEAGGEDAGKKSASSVPTWFAVDIRHEETFAHPVTRAMLAGDARTRDMGVLRRGNRLSIMPVTARESAAVRSLSRKR
jgi:predicted RNA-binding protein with PUA-like domain